jgi:hypothetical protein
MARLPTSERAGLGGVRGLVVEDEYVIAMPPS